MTFTCIFGAMAPHLWLLSFKRTNHLFLNSPNPPPKFGTYAYGRSAGKWAKIGNAVTFSAFKFPSTQSDKQTQTVMGKRHGLTS